MGEIRIVSRGKTRGFPYPVCKNYLYHPYHVELAQYEKNRALSLHFLARVV